MNRVGILFNKFGPYHVARIAGAARYLDVVAIEESPNNSEYEWEKQTIPDGISYTSLDLISGQSHARADLPQRFQQLLQPLHCDVIALPGWSSMVSIELARWCIGKGIPTICMSETNGWDFVRHPLIEHVKRGILAHFASALVTSNSQADYIRLLGMNDQRIFRGYNVVDNDYFASAAHKARLSGEMPVVNGRPLPESWRGQYFLASNRFIDKKNLPSLLRAYARFRSGRSENPADWSLIMLGDGELRDQLRAQTTALGLDNHVHYPGFRQYNELPIFYAAAGAFVHVSKVEQWGLVVNEAMASGVPAIVSKRCGCSEVLLDDGVNGLVIDPNDDNSIYQALVTMAMPGVQARLAAKASTRIAEWGPARFGTGMKEAVAAAVSFGAAKPSLRERLLLRAALLRG